MYKLLIVEDDMGIAQAIRQQAEAWELSVHIAENFRDVLSAFAAVQPHIVVLDITLPFYSGYYWCSEIRKISKVPILFLSSASDNMNIVMAMNLGADDFIAKPFDLSVLIAKIQALLRRSYDFGTSVPVLAHRGAILNTGDDTVTFDGEKIPLTKNEYRILLTLLEKQGALVTRERLMERLWETDSYVDANTLTVNVARLRRKLEAAGLPEFISTKKGQGYLVE